MSVRVVLASASPRRRDLLARWGVDHDILIPEIDETFETDEDAPAAAERLAREKARAVRARLPADERTIVLAADTIVAADSRLLAKPLDAADAHAMLMSLSGKKVRVCSGVACTTLAAGLLSGNITTVLTMHAFDADDARAYVATGEPFGKAGAFAIQGEGARLIAGREGSYSNVVGLPRALTLELLERAGRPEEDAPGV